jgi:hypothetical protein
VPGRFLCWAVPNKCSPTRPATNSAAHATPPPARSPGLPCLCRSAGSPARRFSVETPLPLTLPLPPMPRPKPAPASSGGWFAGWGWDLMFGSIAAFYAVMAPYTKVEESFNVQVPTPAPSLFASGHSVEIWSQYRCCISIVSSIGCLHVLSFSGGRSPPPPLPGVLHTRRNCRCTRAAASPAHPCPP